MFETKGLAGHYRTLINQLLSYHYGAVIVFPTLNHGSFMIWLIWLSTVCYYRQDLIFALIPQDRSDYLISYPAHILCLETSRADYLRTILQKGHALTNDKVALFS